MNLAQDLRIQQVPVLVAIVGGKALNQTIGFTVCPLFPRHILLFSSVFSQPQA